MWIGSLDGAVSKALLKGVSQTMYADGHLLFVRERTLMAQPFDVTRLETAGDAFPLAENIQTGTGGNSCLLRGAERSPRLSGRDAANDYDLVWFDRAGVQGATLGSAY